MRRIYYGLDEEGGPAGPENLAKYGIRFPPRPRQVEELAARPDSLTDPGATGDEEAVTLPPDPEASNEAAEAAWAEVYALYDQLKDDPLAPVLPIPWAWPMSGLTRRMVDSKTGRLASEWCPEEQRYEEWFIPGTEPTEVCDLFGRSIFAR
jgi:hypothetical protein